MNWLISTINFLTEWNSDGYHQLAWGIVWGGLLLGLIGSAVLKDRREHRAQDDTDWEGDVAPWPIRAGASEKGNAGAGSGDGAAFNTLSFHGEQQ